MNNFATFKIKVMDPMTGEPMANTLFKDDITDGVTRTDENGEVIYVNYDPIREYLRCSKDKRQKIDEIVVICLESNIKCCECLGITIDELNEKLPLECQPDHIKTLAQGPRASGPMESESRECLRALYELRRLIENIKF